MNSQMPDVHLREVPAAPWLKIVALGLVLVVIAVGLWEVRMRQLGLTTEDIDDGVAHWAEERRKIDHGDIHVAIVGASRILYDTDLDIWKEVIRHQPLQLALEGTNPRVFMTDLADDADFSGLLVVGVTPVLFFGEGSGRASEAIERYKTESPSQRLGHKMHIVLSRVFAFLDFEHSLFRIVLMNEIPDREGVPGDGGKLRINTDNRQTFVWERLSRDPYLRQHWIDLWMGGLDYLLWTSITDETVDEVIAETKGYIEKIRSRGGEVVFVRPPSSDGFLEREKEYYPRQRFWDRLIAETDTVGIHFEDYPELSEDMVVIEWSHLEKASAQRYSRALARIVQERLAERGHVLPAAEER
jgi:hypothetical protein